MQLMCEHGSPGIGVVLSNNLNYVGLQGGIGTWWWSLFTKTPGVPCSLMLLHLTYMSGHQ